MSPFICHVTALQFPEPVKTLHTDYLLFITYSKGENQDYHQKLLDPVVAAALWIWCNNNPNFELYEKFFTVRGFVTATFLEHRYKMGT